jgi:hypothetical protein
MTQPDKPQGINIQLDIDREVAKGTPCNLAMVSNSQTEFFFDFALLQPTLQAPSAENPQKAIVSSRVVMSPLQAKLLLKALQENVQQYEKRFGVISDRKPGGEQIRLSLN